ncbi:oligosaccharide flippase family protein BpsH (plasmid) [Bacillus tropicus]|uniref:oligosaccharide flippase family protein BpsH n=1 Tax=Bacillus TaxID=1386 RepID=UPI001036893B|nr:MULTISPECIES: oligosaccharide flippase family protein BpsH [Bacillus]WBO93055.1 oligosaccharide flippase family protein BpsH [Bacillus tropicus]
MSKIDLSKSLIGSIGVYTITQIINAFIPFVMIPILTRYLNPEEFGMYSMFKITAGLVFSFIGIGINGAITKLYYEKEKKELAIYVFNSFFLVTIMSLLLFILFEMFSSYTSSISSIPASWLWTVIFASYGKVLFQVTLVIFQMEKKPISFGAFQLIQTATNFLLNMIFVVSLSLNWKGALLAEVSSFFVFSLIGIYILRKSHWLHIKLDKSDIKHSIKFGIPIIPHVIGMYIITVSDRFLVSNMIGLQETGIYTVGSQIAMIIMILQESFNKAWVPWLFSNLKKDKLILKKRIVKITYLYYVVILVGVIILSMISPLVVTWFAGFKYQGADKYIFWLALGYAFNGMYKMVTNYIFYVGKTYYLSIVTAITALINLGLSYLLILLNGAIGAAQATAISYFISFILTFYLSNKVYKMPWALIENKN